MEADSSSICWIAELTYICVTMGSKTLLTAAVLVWHKKNDTVGFWLVDE